MKKTHFHYVNSAYTVPIPCALYVRTARRSIRMLSTIILNKLCNFFRYELFQRPSFQTPVILRLTKIIRVKPHSRLYHFLLLRHGVFSPQRNCRFRRENITQGTLTPSMTSRYHDVILGVKVS